MDPLSHCFRASVLSRGDLTSKIKGRIPSTHPPEAAGHLSPEGILANGGVTFPPPYHQHQGGDGLPPAPLPYVTIGQQSKKWKI